ncbi:tRNA-(ms[2]io[6]A)-hydroxylase [Pseudidiomarina sediminum]|uniref:tRNA-(Ms[2]io[6]A)-hydroxylase n=2 Tax=Pseudidiomarina sediminum TaxID=431675 RepID=A0A432ZAE4_9GAMM|nr:tRNA isopentenyl-2-thiomethyl-A-37 hydroxylase MiaE [Pseudidiomarina sediminum]RUO74352.1 tRNA-(ms[2]io[6]A)-hydroxylase [Pseudidiomarina sediminum]
MNMQAINKLLMPIRGFLHCETPDAWIAVAKQPQHLPTLLRDHMVCELKAAQSAMLLIRRYAVDDASGEALLKWLAPYEDYTYRLQGDWRELANCNGLRKAMVPRSGKPYSQELIDKMVLLIKEELHHFYQVLEVADAHGIAYDKVTSSRYAKELFRHVRTHEPATLIDKLICGAYIEARSCERFAKLAPHLPADIGEFYISLLRSEARHYQDYLTLAEAIAGASIAERIAFFGAREAELIATADDDFKFHSGVPTATAAA